MRRYYAEVVSGAKVDDLPEFLSADYVEVHNNKRYLVGIDGAKEHILGVHKTYRNLRIAVERQIAEGEWVVTQITAAARTQALGWA